MHINLTKLYETIKIKLPQTFDMNLLKKIKVNLVDSGELNIQTSFQAPHLDVSITIQQDGDYVIDYSHGNYSERWNNNDENKVSEEIIELIEALVSRGATKVDMVHKGTVYRTTTTIPSADTTTNIRKVNPFILKKKLITKYPPVVSNTKS